MSLQKQPCQSHHCQSRGITKRTRSFSDLKRGTRMADAHFASKNTLLKTHTLHCHILLKEQFASKWLVTVCSLTQFTPQHTLPPGIFFSSAQFASQHPLLLKTPCSSTHFASQHTLLLRTLCSSAHFASKNTLLLGTLYSSTHFAS